MVAGCGTVQPWGTAVGLSGNNRGGAVLRVRDGAPPHVSEPRRALGSLPHHPHQSGVQGLTPALLGRPLLIQDRVDTWCHIEPLSSLR